MNKNIQAIIAISFLIISISIPYYLFKFNPEQNKISLQNKLQTQCQEVGTKKELEDNKYKEENIRNGIAFSNTYIFNKDTNACLYKTVTIYVGTGITEGTITDLFSNKTLAEYRKNNDDTVTYGDEGRYLYIERMNF